MNRTARCPAQGQLRGGGGGVGEVVGTGPAPCDIQCGDSIEKKRACGHALDGFAKEHLHSVEESKGGPWRGGDSLRTGG